jgi:hypothetical protein
MSPGLQLAFEFYSQIGSSTRCPHRRGILITSDGLCKARTCPSVLSPISNRSR